MSDNYYEILGISKTANAEEIKQSYRKLARTNHPDKGGNVETFKKIQTAYETLSDEQKRNQYDNPNQMPSFFQNGGMPGGMPGGFPFNMFFNMGGGGGNRNVKKEDEYFNCKITLKDVFYGINKAFNIKRKYICEMCRKHCHDCNGTGTRTQQIQMGPMVQFINQQCGACNATGSTKSNNCNDCQSSGFKTKEKIIELNIPKGVEHGKQYKYSGWGQQKTKPNEIDGDFFINIQVEQHSFYKRDKLNLYCSIDINLVESIIGKSLEIPHLNDIPLKIETNKFGIINPNKDYIIAEQGLINEYGEKKGDLYIKFNITYPDRTLKDKEIELLRETFNVLKI